MSTAYWRTDHAFELLCDMVASDSLVCITGTGASFGLKQKIDSTRALPDWHGLLKALFTKMSSRLSSQDKTDCIRLLRLDPSTPADVVPSGPDLILSASILRAVAPPEFDSIFRTEVTNADGSFTLMHEVVLELKPAGILTFNYDTGHENAAAKHGTVLTPITPSDEKSLVRALQTRQRPFYLKAHGSLDSAAELVLTDETYRELLVKSPAYRAFVHNILINFNLLFVGFRISDPDFDVFIETLANQFGSPLHGHVAVFHERDRTVNDISLRRRYGIHVLYVKDFADIPKILREALTVPGPKLQQELANALSASMSDRQAAHQHFETLGPAGRVCASNVMRSRVDEFKTLEQQFELSEAAYSLGIIDARYNKDILMDIVESADHADPAGRALTVLRPVLDNSDLPRLKQWLARVTAKPLDGTYADRIPKYIDYLLTYVPAKLRS